MKFYKVILFSILALITMGCEDDVYIPERPDIASQVVLFYVPGTDLGYYTQLNIDDIKSVVSRSMPNVNGRIFVCYQPKANNEAELVEIYYDYARSRSEIRIVKEYKKDENDPNDVGFNAASQEQVEAVFADVGNEAPSESYGLIIGTHGKGWVPASKALRSTYGATMQEDDLWQKDPNALVTRAIGDLGYELNITELAAAIDAQSYSFDYIVFDACFMSNIETLYDLRNSTKYVVGSVCEVMGAGFPFKKVIPQLFLNGGKDYDLHQVCYEFWNFYQNDWASSYVPTKQSGAIALTVTSEIDALADVASRINHSAPQHFDLSTLQYYEGLSSHLFYDWGQYVEQICTDDALLEEFKLKFDKAFPAKSRLHTPTFYTAYGGQTIPIRHYSGVNISEPSERYVDENRATAWYIATH